MKIILGYPDILSWLFYDLSDHENLTVLSTRELFVCSMFQSLSIKYFTGAFVYLGVYVATYLYILY